MPHRALFVSQCHHFSPVIYFIAISVSLSPPLPSLPSLFLHLRSPRSFSLSFSLLLSQPPSPCPRTPSRSLKTLHRTTQHNSALLTLSWRLYYTLLFLSRSLLSSFSVQEREREESSNCRFVFSFARVCLAPTAFGRLCRMRERENAVERMTEKEREREHRYREERRR